METLEAMVSRRSVRLFTREKVSKEILEECLEAAMQAPSAHDEEPWEFVLVETREFFDSVPNLSLYKNATLGILICADLRLTKTEGFWMQDCAACTQNFLLALWGKGVGGVWTSVYPKEEKMKLFQKKFKLPQEIIPFAFVIAGFPEIKAISIPNRFEKERIFYNKFSEKR